MGDCWDAYKRVEICTPRPPTLMVTYGPDYFYALASDEKNVIKIPLTREAALHLISKLARGAAFK